VHFITRVSTYVRPWPSQHIEWICVTNLIVIWGLYLSSHYPISSSSYHHVTYTVIGVHHMTPLHSTYQHTFVMEAIPSHDTSHLSTYQHTSTYLVISTNLLTSWTSISTNLLTSISTNLLTSICTHLITFTCILLRGVNTSPVYRTTHDATYHLTHTLDH
jgi:hypothetical protein